MYIFLLNIPCRVNAAGLGIRSIVDVKKKWQDLQSSTKTKEATRRRDQVATGGGPAPDPLKDFEIKVYYTVVDYSRGQYDVIWINGKCDIDREQ